MKIILILLLMYSTVSISRANGGAAALDEMIARQKSSINQAREAKKTNQDKDLDQLFNDLIAAHEKELNRMNELRKKLYPEVKKSAKELSEIQKDFSAEIKRMESELQNVIKEFRSRMTKSTSSVSSPKIEIKETNKGYDIKAEVPGMDKDDINVKVVQNQLQIEGRRKEEIKKVEEGVISSEFEYGEFKRTIPLDEKVDPSSLKTDYENGILMVELNKARTKG